MRNLNREEIRSILSILVKFNRGTLLEIIKELRILSRTFRFNKNRIFFSSTFQTLRVSSVKRNYFASVGICIAKKDKNKKIKILIPSIYSLLYEKSKNFIFLNRKGENELIKGNNLTRTLLENISGHLLKGDGVIMVNSERIKLGFGEIIENLFKVNLCQSNKVLIINKTNIGEYNKK